MLIEVMFRDVFKKEFTTGPYTYNCDIEVKPDDIVIVETKFGISLAQVHRLNVKLVNEKDRPMIKNVLELCKTQYASSRGVCKWRI